MFWLKACERCNGDLLETAEVGFTYISCIQCGKELTVEQEEALTRHQVNVRETRTATPLRTSPERVAA